MTFSPDGGADPRPAPERATPTSSPPHATMPADLPQGALVPAVAKAVAVVRHLNLRGPAGASLAELVASLDVTRSHCHNILRTLAALDWIAYVPDKRVYRLKPGLLADSSSLLDSGAAAADLRPSIRKLATRLKLACVLSRLEPDDSFVVIDKVDGVTDLGVTVSIGHHFPPDAPVQRRAALAWLGEAEIAAWLRDWQPTPYTATTIVDRGVFADELAATRARGYARSRSEFMEAVMSFGLPIFDRAGRVTLILQCPGLQEQMRLREAEVTAALTETVAEIHGVLGGRPPEGFPGTPVRADGA